MNAQYLADEPLTQFLQDARKFDYLSPEAERDLGIRWRDHKDPDALNRLIGSHLRLVVKMAKGFRGYGLPMADLVSEGNLGLMQAVEKFDPDRGFRFATYAAWWIRAAMQSYILHNWSLVKMGTTAAQKKLFFNLSRLKKEMRELESGDMAPETVASIAETLDVTEQDVVDMNRRMSGSDSSLNAMIGYDSEREAQEMLIDERPSQENTVADAEELSVRRRLLKLGLDKLNDRERAILLARRLKDEPTTLEELSQKYAVSRERVRQIEVKAFEKLQKAMRAAAHQLNMPAAGALVVGHA
jgi:RNA polymerase sigma-32 factor